MKTALQRQLSALGWRALGFAGTTALVLVGIFLWGSHIEGRIDQVVVERHRDHIIIRRPDAERGGDASQPAPIAGQQPKPGKEPGGKQHVGGGHPKGKTPKVPPAPTPQPSPAPEATSPPVSTPPAEEPGESGETPAAEKGNGVKACVDLVVSACVDAGLKPQAP